MLFAFTFLNFAGKINASLSGSSCWSNMGPVLSISSIRKTSRYDLDSALNHIMVSDPDQNNKLSMLDGDKGSIYPDSPPDIWKD